MTGVPFAVLGADAFLVGTCITAVWPRCRPRSNRSRPTDRDSGYDTMRARPRDDVQDETRNDEMRWAA